MALFPFPGRGDNICHVFVSCGSCHAPTSSLLWCPEVKQKYKWRVNRRTTWSHSSDCQDIVETRCLCSGFIYLFIFVSHHKKSVISALLRKEEGKYHVDRGTELILFGCLVAKHNVFLITNQWNLCDEWLAQVWSPPSPDRCPTSLIHPSDICCSPATSLSSSELLHWRQTIIISHLPFVADCFFNFGSKKRLRPGSQVGRTIPPALTNTYVLTLLSMFKPFSRCADW